MSVRSALYALVILFATTAISADNGAADASQKAQDETAGTSPRVACVNLCEAAEGRCSREVRNARRDCERVAANGGREVFTGRNDAHGIDYGRFCSYFADPDFACGSGSDARGCRSRLAVRHGICLGTMENVAQLHYDCFRTERDANNQCRAELADCKAACQ
jgi:hypothetical protein